MKFYFFFWNLQGPNKGWMLKTGFWSSFIHIEWEYNYTSPVAGLQERETKNKKCLLCSQFVNLTDKVKASVSGSPCIVLVEKNSFRDIFKCSGRKGRVCLTNPMLNLWPTSGSSGSSVWLWKVKQSFQPRDTLPRGVRVFLLPFLQTPFLPWQMGSWHLPKQGQ